MAFNFILSIYFISTLSFSLSLQEELISVGCFTVPASFKNHSLDYPIKANLTGAIACVKACKKVQYRFAGVIDNHSCRCGQTFFGNSSADCKACNSDSHYSCGSKNAISVYETGGTVPGVPIHLVLLNASSNGLHITWEAPISDGSPVIENYEITAVPLKTMSGVDPPSLRTWKVGADFRSHWLSDVNPATQYTVEVRAGNSAGLGNPASIEGWTTIGHPPIPTIPEMISRSPETITVKMHTVSPDSGPITAYQVVVVDETIGAIMNPAALTDYYNASKQMLPYYIAAEFSPEEFLTVFTVGDNNTYGGYYNALLKINVDYHILLGALSTVNKTLASYSPSDHDQHASSDLEHGHFHPMHIAKVGTDDPNVHIVHESSGLMIGLSICIGILGCLVLVAIIVYIALRVYLKAPRRPDHQVTFQHFSMSHHILFVFRHFEYNENKIHHQFLYL